MVNKKHGKTRTVPFRRKREGKTRYKNRLSLLKSGVDRLVVRKSLNTITVQAVKYAPDGDIIDAAASSQELRKLGWKMHGANIPCAYLTGLLLGVKAKKKKLGKVILDTGLQIPHKGGRVFAAVKGVLDAGLDLNCGEDALPEDDKINGKHITDYAAKLSENKEAYAKQFSRYIKNGVKPEEITKAFEEIKKKILAL